MALAGLPMQGICPFTETESGGVKTETLGTGTYTSRIMKFAASPTREVAEIYAGDAKDDEEEGAVSGTITVERSQMSLAEEAAYLGHTYTEEDGLVAKDTDTAPYLRCAALARGIDKGKVYYRVTCYMKVKFSVAGDEYETKGKSPALKSRQLSGTLFANKDGVFKTVKDFTGETALTSATAFFKQMLNITEA